MGNRLVCRFAAVGIICYYYAWVGMFDILISVTESPISVCHWNIGDMRLENTVTGISVTAARRSSTIARRAWREGKLNCYCYRTAPSRSSLWRMTISVTKSPVTRCARISHSPIPNLHNHESHPTLDNTIDYTIHNISRLQQQPTLFKLNSTFSHLDLDHIICLPVIV